jgi:hypothetical protein
MGGHGYAAGGGGETAFRRLTAPDRLAIIRPRIGALTAPGGTPYDRKRKFFAGVAKW